MKKLVLEEFLQDTNCPDVFAFHLFTDAFCDALVQEVRSVQQSGIKVQRPNSMNNYGVILNEIGMEPFLDFIQNLLRPVGEARWGRAGAAWDSHHTFIVQYSP